MDRSIRRFVRGYLLQQLSDSSLFILFSLTFHVLLSDLGHNELGDLETGCTHEPSLQCVIITHTAWE